MRAKSTKKLYMYIHTYIILHKHGKEMQGIFHKTTVVIGANDMHRHENGESNTKTIIGCLNVTCLSMAHYRRETKNKKKEN